MAYGTVNTDIVSDSSGGRLAPISSVFRNRIINGACVIDQRNAGASVTPTADGQYTLDRWSAQNSVASKYSVQQVTTAPAGFANSLKVTSLSTYTVGSAEAFGIIQYVEGYNVADLNWGTANAKTVTLSAWVQSSLTGTFGGSIYNSALNRSYPFSYSIPVANTWTQISVTIAGDTSGTWLTNNGRGLSIDFSIGMGSTLSNTAGSWYSGLYLSATGATSVVGTNGATFYITGVQLEVGSSATGFEYRQYGQELALCQRYCFGQNTAAAGSPTAYYSFGTGFGVGAGQLFANVTFPVTMRAYPSVTFTAANTFFYPVGSGYTTVALDQVSKDNGNLNITGGSGGTAGFGGRFLSNGSTPAYIIWTAEL